MSKEWLSRCPERWAETQTCLAESIQLLSVWVSKNLESVTMNDSRITDGLRFLVFLNLKDATSSMASGLVYTKHIIAYGDSTITLSMDIPTVLAAFLRGYQPDELYGA